MSEVATKVLVTGANGQLGRSFKKICEQKGISDILYTDINTLDITDQEALEKILKSNKITHILNFAAYTAVDKAEEDVEKAYLLNSTALKIIGEVTKRKGIKVLHVSTDYVFDGENTTPYKETDNTFPHTVYGLSKLSGEKNLLRYGENVIIIRTSWLYSEYGKNFLKTILALSKSQKTLTIVKDQKGTPTYASDLAEMIFEIVYESIWQPGIYHFSNQGETSWYAFAKEIIDLAQIKDVEIHPVTTDAYPTKAKRPKYSVLDKTKIKTTYNHDIPYWKDSLKECLKAMG